MSSPLFAASSGARACASAAQRECGFADLFRCVHRAHCALRWVKRKTRESFRGTLTANGKTSVEELFKRAEEELRMLERTSTMYKMYKPRHPTILDVKK